MGKAARTKQHIIEKAAAIMNVKGISGTSVEEVLDSAKVARGCLYGHFKTKEDLAVASAEYLLETFKEDRLSYTGTDISAKTRIFSYLSGQQHPLKNPITGGCPILNLATEADDTNPHINKLIKKNIDSYLEFFKEILEEGIAAGEFSEDLVPEEFALKIFTTIEGALMVCQVKNSKKPMLVVIDSLKKELSGYCTMGEPA